MDRLEIRLLGSFTALQDNQKISAFRSSKSRALLAYLAAQPDQDHPRTKLAALLWGNLPEQAARTNLRIELSRLKQLLSAHPALEISRNTVRVHHQYLTVDAVDFREAVSEFHLLLAEIQGRELHRLDAAINLYQGEFLAGLQINDAPEFEEWQLIVQEQLHQQFMLALSTLQRHHAEQGNWLELAATASRQLAVVPWTESAHRNLIHAFAAQGERNAALKQYAECRRILREELGVEPSLATQEFADRLLDQSAVKSSSRHNLARQLKALIGREEEHERVRALVLRERLVTLFGMGGVGKSRLAQAVAQSTLRDFEDGVWFVPLANIEPGESAPDQIALAITGAAGIQIGDAESPSAELAAHFTDKHALLVLDNWEHLVTEADAILYPLLLESNVHILATSRVRLMIEGEMPVRLSGLTQDHAYALFVDRAQRTLATFMVDDGDVDLIADIFAICKQVDGLPLGIELTASWVEHFSVAEIELSLAEIEVEPNKADRLVRRHHSLTSVLEYSWRLLSPTLQHVLMRFSVFRGGFDRSAASIVADSSLNELSSLLGHSLVQRVAAGRYDLHPLVQEFAAGKLPPDQEVAVRRRHSHHYLEALIATSRAQRSDRLLDDFENIRSAWQHSINAGESELIQRVAPQFGEYIGQFGLLSDGHRLFADGVEGFARQPNQNELVALLLDQQWVFARPIYGLNAASTLQHRLLTLTADVELQVKTHLELANRHAEAAEWPQADEHFDQAEVLAEESDDSRIYIRTAARRIHVNALQFRGDFGEGIERLQGLLTQIESLEEAEGEEESEPENLRIVLLASLSLLAIRYGNYGLALCCGRQSLAWAEDLAHQHRKVPILLSIALSEQFAGMYDQAIAHNLEGLALAEAIGADDDVGLLKANLCLTMRQSGELEQGLQHGLEAIETLQTLGLVRMEGQARNRVGHTLSALGRWADAYAAYEEALVVWEPQQHSNRYEAMAGQAVAACQLGLTDEAQSLVGKVLDFVTLHGLLGLVEPVLLLLNCETVLTAIGQAQPACEVLQQADAWVQMIANRIDDDAVREAFLHNRPDNQLLKIKLKALSKH